MIDKALFKLPGIHAIFAMLVLFAAAQAALILGQSFSLAKAIVNLWDGNPAHGELRLLAVFFACFVGKHFVLFLQSSILDSYAKKTSGELRQELLKRIFITRAQVVRDNGTASITSSVLEGCNQIENYIKVIVPKIIGVAIIPIAVLVAVFLQDWVSGVILTVMFPVIIFFMVMLGKQARAYAQRQYGEYQRMSNHFIDTLRGMDTLKAFDLAKSYSKRVYDVSERFRKATVDTLKVATLSGAVLDLASVFGIGAVALMLGVRLIEGSILLLPALITLILSPEYFKPIREFGSDFHASLDGKNALAAVQKILAGSQSESEHVEVKAWAENSTLRLENVAFKYPALKHDASDGADAEMPDALRDITFEAKGFEKVGVVGLSGSGKSTLVSILGGFGKPTQGSFAIDANAFESLQIDGWQEQVAYIPQDPYIFNATLRENIAFNKPDAADSEIMKAVSLAGLEPVLESLPYGLDTLIGQKGRALSGGQAQRIALARVLLDPTRKILLFDEPTAHLDIETEYELKQRMLCVMQDKLVIFATHRLHWLEQMDRVLVLDNGQIVEEGSPQALLAGNGKLRELVDSMVGGELQ